MNRAARWSPEKIRATPAQFRKLISGQDAVACKRLAVSAGKKMAQQMAKANRPDHVWSVKDLGPLQIEHWRRTFNVPPKFKNVMLCVAWSSLRKWNYRHSLYKPKPIQKGQQTQGKKRIWRKAPEHKKGPRHASLFTCIHDKLYYRVCQNCRRNKVEAYQRLERIIAKYLTPADSAKMLRRLHSGKVTRTWWRLLRRKLGVVEKKRAFPHGSSTYHNFIRRRRRALKRQHHVVPASMVPQQPILKRLVPHKVAYSPTLCIAMDDPISRSLQPASVARSVLRSVPTEKGTVMKTFEVEMLAFADGKIRKVSVPEIAIGTDAEPWLNEVFYYGQNEFCLAEDRSQRMRNVSVGDVIRLDGKRYRVEMIGFEELV